MKIESFHVEEFANEEHRGLQVEDLDGDSLLLRGGTRTGKTLTFNAILYNLLSARETIDLATGRQNKVEVEFTDGTSFFRGNPQSVYDNGDTEFESQEAVDKLSEKLGGTDLTKSHFVHSHIGKMPLDNLSKDKRISLIRSVTNHDLQIQLRRYENAAAHLEEIVNETEDKARRDTEQLSEIERQLDDLESQLEKNHSILEKVESGELEKIRDQLLADQRLEKQLDELFKRKEGIRKRLRKLGRQKRKQENYSSEVRTVIAEAVNDFVCPTCDRRITTEKAKRRLQQNVCPFCGRKHKLEELSKNIEDRIDRSDEILETLESEIEALREERSEVNKKIKQLQSNQPELQNLDRSAKVALDRNGNDIDKVESAVQEKIRSIESSIEELQERKTEIDSTLDDFKAKLKEYSEAHEHALEKVEQIEDESFEADIQSFTEAWEGIYMEMSGDIGLEINVTQEGEIQLPGRNSLREYDSGGNLSGSELRLLNLSFACTLSKFAKENKVTEWQTIVFDEPFDNLNEETTKSALEYLQSAEQQFIVTSSDEMLDEYFPNVNEMTSDPIQSKLGDFL